MSWELEKRGKLTVYPTFSFLSRFLIICMNIIILKKKINWSYSFVFKTFLVKRFLRGVCVCVWTVKIYFLWNPTNCPRIGSPAWSPMWIVQAYTRVLFWFGVKQKLRGGVSISQWVGDPCPAQELERVWPSCLSPTGQGLGFSVHPWNQPHPWAG